MIFKAITGSSRQASWWGAGNVDILKYFVEERGCDLEVNDTSLVTAIESGNLEVVQYLSSVGTSNTSKLGVFS